MTRFSIGTALAIACAAFLFMGKAQAGEERMENSALEVAFDTETALIAVRDKRNDYTWRQSAEVRRNAPSVAVGKVERGGGFMQIELEGEGLSGMRIAFGPEESTIYVRLDSADGDGYGRISQYPHPFVMERDSGYIVQCTASDGVIFPFSELDQMRSPFNLDGGMSWYGVTDLKKGCICVLESFQHQGTASYPMQLRYHFTTEGGFVGLAKYYRGIAQLQGKVVTLAKKMAEIPAIEKMAGAAVIYLWGHARSPEMIQELKQAGIDRAMTMWDLNHPPGPTETIVKAADDAGYICGPYDIYLAIMNPATGWEKGRLLFNTDRRNWPEGWPEALINYVPGVRPPEKDTPETAYVCSNPLVDWAKSRIREEMRHLNYSARFFDTLIPQVRPCESPLHPLNLEESRNERRELLRWTLEDMNQITGSGEGYHPDWAVPVTCWLEGAMTLRSYTTGYVNNPASLPDGREDWTDDYSPAAVTKDMPPDETLFDYQLNPARRIPLLGLVYHDCVMTTWVWRNANHRFIGAQRDADLMNILFGNMPLWSLTPEIWKEKKDVLVESYRQISDWTRKIAFDEMTDYRWLGRDGKVAMSSFSSGWNVAVNMTDEDFDFDGKLVKAKDFVTWRDSE